MENVVGQPVKVDTQKAEKGQEADPAKATPLCCTGYAVFVIALMVLIAAVVSTALELAAGSATMVPMLRLIRLFRLLPLALLVLIPCSWWLLQRGNTQPVPRGCETCGCACGCAFLPIGLLVVALLRMMLLVPALVHLESEGWPGLAAAAVNVVTIIGLSVLGRHWLHRLRARDPLLSRLAASG
mmetsp:Transcript_98857/g.307486  ORF Transcript_98857/g.307486 Transcript_98857/m.307486 type:complete len:184 (+) Transcript_98857:90-641(+)